MIRKQSTSSRSFSPVNKWTQLLLGSDPEAYYSFDRVVEACSRLLGKLGHPGPTDLSYFPTKLLLESKDSGHRKVLLLLLSLLIDASNSPWPKIASDLGLPDLEGRAVLIANKVTEYSRFISDFRKWNFNHMIAARIQAPGIENIVNLESLPNLFFIKQGELLTTHSVPLQKQQMQSILVSRSLGLIPDPRENTIVIINKYHESLQSHPMFKSIVSLRKLSNKFGESQLHSNKTEDTHSSSPSPLLRPSKSIDSQIGSFKFDPHSNRKPSLRHTATQEFSTGGTKPVGTGTPSKSAKQLVLNFSNLRTPKVYQIMTAAKLKQNRTGSPKNSDPTATKPGGLKNKPFSLRRPGLDAPPPLQVSFSGTRTTQDRSFGGGSPTSVALQIKRTPRPHLMVQDTNFETEAIGDAATVFEKPAVKNTNSPMISSAKDTSPSSSKVFFNQKAFFAIKKKAKPQKPQLTVPKAVIVSRSTSQGLPVQEFLDSSSDSSHSSTFRQTMNLHLDVDVDTKDETTTPQSKNPHSGESRAVIRLQPAD